MLRLQGALPPAPPLLRPAVPFLWRPEPRAARRPTVDLRGRVALVTGARVKIGYQAAILLLRAGCNVVACTRFPRDAAARYAREPDFAGWKRPAHDLRHRPAAHPERGAALPAAGRHAPAARLPDPQRLPDRAAPAGLLRPPAGARRRCRRSALPDERAWARCADYEELRAALARGAAAGVDEPGAPLPGRGGGRSAPARQDRARPLPARRARPGPPAGGSPHAQLLAPRAPRGPDARAARGAAGQRDRAVRDDRAAEAAHAPRAGAPPGTATSGDPAKHVVLVSAMEGQFYREHKTDKHPHTNMAKAALNMIVRTSAPDYARDGILPERGRHRLGHRRGPGPPGGAEGGGARLLAAAGHRGRRGADRGADHGRLPEREARGRALLQGLPAYPLVRWGPRRPRPRLAPWEQRRYSSPTGGSNGRAGGQRWVRRRCRRRSGGHGRRARAGGGPERAPPLRLQQLPVGHPRRPRLAAASGSRRRRSGPTAIGSTPLVALDAEAVTRHRGELSEGGVVLFNSDRGEGGGAAPRPGRAPVPGEGAGRRRSGRSSRSSRTRSCSGGSSHLLGLPLERLEEALAKQFGGKGEPVVARNVALARAGFEHARGCFAPLPASGGWAFSEKRRAVDHGERGVRDGGGRRRLPLLRRLPDDARHGDPPLARARTPSGAASW